MKRIQEVRSSRPAAVDLRRLCLWLAPLGLGLAAAHAQEAATPPAAQASDDFQEIVVTATRRSENLSKVPISITAITKEDLDLKGVKDIQDVARFTPGISVDRSGTSNISIRGIASSGGAGTTGIYIDDTPIQMRALAFDPDEAVPKSFDIERVEVLRGPQGTLFGAGSEGGTVRYITTQPSLTSDSVYGRAEVSSTRGGDMSYEAGVAAGGPIVDGTFGARIAVWYRKDGGWIDRVDPTAANPEATVVEKNANHGESLMVRLAGLWALNDRWTFTPSVIYQDRKINDVSNYWPIYSHGDQFVSGNPTQNPTPDKFYLPSFKVEGKFDKVTLISNTSYYHREETSGYDGTLYNLGFYQTFGGFMPGVPAVLVDGTGLHLKGTDPLNPFDISGYRSPATVDNGQINFTQEVRLQSNDDASRLKWTAGAFYTKNRQRYLEQIHDPMLETFTQAVFGASISDEFGIGYDPVYPTDSYFLLTQAVDEQLAGYGEGTFEITDRLKLTLGARYSDMKYSFTTVTGGPQLFGPTDVPTHGSISETAFTPKATLAFQATPQHMFYGTYAKGFRPGGANNPLPQVACQQDFDNFGITAAPTTYKSDSTDSFEVGAKNNFDNRFRIASSMFFIKWHDIQQTVVPPICQISYIDNLGDAEVKGVDFQADLSIVEGLAAQFTAGYTDARYTHVKPGIPVIAVNNAISGTGGFAGQTPSPFTAALGLEYKFQALGHESFVRGDFDYHKRANWLPASQDPSTLQYDGANFTVPGTTFLTMRAGMKLGEWSAELFCDNCTDNATITGYDHSIDPGTGDTRLFRAMTFRPLTYGLTFIYRH
jgi:outer membrane receptor protein involved in Fe transport